MVVFGRENETAHLARFLNGTPNKLIIKAPTADEAVALVAASVVRMEKYVCYFSHDLVI
ncbi:MAG: hypothetical protein ACTHKY_19445 [Ginsengibacter sp.]